MSKFTVKCDALPGYHDEPESETVVSLWLECDEENVKEYGKELAKQVWQETAEIMEILPGHISQNIIGVTVPCEWSLDEIIINTSCDDPKEDKSAEWFLERGFVASFGAM